MDCMKNSCKWIKHDFRIMTFLVLKGYDINGFKMQAYTLQLHAHEIFFSYIWMQLREWNMRQQYTWEASFEKML